jgi:hypothetical protein
MWFLPELSFLMRPAEKAAEAIQRLEEKQLVDAEQAGAFV